MCGKAFNLFGIKFALEKNRGCIMILGIVIREGIHSYTYFSFIIIVIMRMMASKFICINV